MVPLRSGPKTSFSSCCEHSCYHWTRDAANTSKLNMLWALRNIRPNCANSHLKVNNFFFPSLLCGLWRPAVPRPARSCPAWRCCRRRRSHWSATSRRWARPPCCVTTTSWPKTSSTTASRVSQQGRDCAFGDVLWIIFTCGHVAGRQPSLVINLHEYCWQ